MLGLVAHQLRSFTGHPSVSYWSGPTPIPAVCVLAPTPALNGLSCGYPSSTTSREIVASTWRPDIYSIAPHTLPETRCVGTYTLMSTNVADTRATN